MASKYDVSALVNKLNEKEKARENGGSSNFPTDMWRPTIEKGEKRVEYVIRFLENPDSITGFANVDRHAHMVKFANGKYLSQPCSKKANKEDSCYICEVVDVMFKSKQVTQENIAKAQYAKARYFYNILVIQDPRDDGKNEGKVFLFEAGKQIQDKCNEFLKNKQIKESERCFFHPLKGTNFEIVVTIKSDFPNYDLSNFMRSCSPMEINGKEVKTIEEGEKFCAEKCFKLNEYLFQDKFFKPYDEIKQLYLNQGMTSKDKNKQTTKEHEEVDEVEEKPKKPEMKTTVKSKPPEPEEEDETEPFEEDESETTEDSEDDELARLLNDD